MNETQINQDDEINLLDYLIVLLKRKKLIIIITFGVAIITAIYSFTLPPIYKAETKILPPQQSSTGTAAQLISQFGGAASLLGGAVGTKSSSDLYMGLMKSRPVLDRIIDRFKLMELYKSKSREGARFGLAGIIKSQDDKKSGIITVGIENKDPKLAADLANAFIEELRIFNKGLAVTEASQRRLFFEEQLKDAKESLVRAEETMKGFQERTGAVQIDAQSRAVLEGIANLRAQIAAKEVQLKVIRTYATSQNPDLQNVDEELKGLKIELSKLESRGGSGYNTLMPTGRVPSIGTEYVRKVRDLKFNETLYELLLKQYEAAKLDEARDATVIQVIEKAIPPEQKIKPKRRQMVMIAAVTGFFFSIFAAFFMEYKEKASKDPENKERLETLKKYLNLSLKG